MPFQSNVSVYYPKGTNHHGVLADIYRWRDIPREKFIKRLNDNHVGDSAAIILFLMSKPKEVYRMRNIFYRCVLK